MKHLLKTIILSSLFASIAQIGSAENEQKSEVRLSSRPSHISSSAVKPSRTPARVDLPFVVYYNQSDNTLEISSEESVLLDCSIHNEDNNQVILSSLLPVDSVNDCVISLNFLESDSYSLIIIYEGLELFGSIMIN